MKTVMTRIVAICLLMVLSACAATTQLGSTAPEATIQIKGQDPAPLPDLKKLPTTSFGKYEFVVKSPGFDPMYGVLPLKFNGGYLALDILFFAPAAFFNLREVFPEYEFDVTKNELRYRKKDEDQWTVYKPTAAEVEKAKVVLGTE